MESSATQAAASSAANSQLQITLLAKQLSVVKQQGQQMVELLQAISKNIDTGHNFDAQA
jgi:hypothetical protein